jgi:hypothetical protein
MLYLKLRFNTKTSDKINFSKMQCYTGEYIHAEQWRKTVFNIAISWHEQVTFVEMMMSTLYYTNIFSQCFVRGHP